MIKKEEIEEKSRELGVNTSDVQRDYVFGWLLSGLYRNDNALRDLLILKGGNAFRKAYFEVSRLNLDRGTLAVRQTKKRAMLSHRR